MYQSEYLVSTLIRIYASISGKWTPTFTHEGYITTR